MDILLFRHAEKTGLAGDPGLSALGAKRAAALAGAFAARFGKFDELIAAKSIEKSARPFLTLAPFAQRTGQPIDQSWNTYDLAALAAHLKAQKSGQRILVCWRHNTLPDLARELGAGSVPGWPQDLYERIWMLTLTSEQTHWVQLHQVWTGEMLEIRDKPDSGCP